MQVRKGIYRHFKGGLAEVIGEAKNSETGEIFVAYYHKESETGNTILWIRPKKMFLEKVEYQSKKVPRFKFVSER
jgi:hypothetical protein